MNLQFEARRVDVAFYVHHKPSRWMNEASSTLRREPL